MARDPQVTVLGGGLAGCEAAWQLAEAGASVCLVDMKPARRSEAHVSPELAELLCSNSLRSQNPQNAVGLIKEEMQRLGSLVMRVAKETAVPAGDALAVNRDGFAKAITAALSSHPRITRRSELVERLPAPELGEVIVATGPLTEARLAQDIIEKSGRERLYFYDAIAPIVAASSLDREVVYAASRYGKGGGDDYLNCPLDKQTYETFIDALLGGECMPLRPFEEPRYFPGCLPVEVVAQSGRDALRFGAMKPVGLDDPRTGRWPYAVVQLRKEDRAGQAYNLVGFQTKLKQPEQRRVFQLIPGLGRAEFLRFGAIHRNTYLDSPALLDERMRLRSQPNLRFAGQMTGVEGYVESAAHGLVTARLLISDLSSRPIPPPPAETALGGLWAHVTGAVRVPGRAFEPQNVNWSMMPPPPANVRKSDTKPYRVNRARAALVAWAEQWNIALAPAPAPGLAPEA